MAILAGRGPAVAKLQDLVSVHHLAVMEKVLHSGKGPDETWPEGRVGLEIRHKPTRSLVKFGCV